MSIMNMFARMFGKRISKDGELYPPKDVEKIVKAPYDYGLGMTSQMLLASGDYGWQNISKDGPRFILTNVDDCKERISVWGMVSAWRGTGHVEWEALLAIAFVTSVVKALENGESEADITDIFNRDLLASGDLVFSKEQIYDHLIKWFDIEESSPEEKRLKLHLG